MQDEIGLVKSYDADRDFSSYRKRRGASTYRIESILLDSKFPSAPLRERK